MSQENVEFVRRLHPTPDANLAQILRDDLKWASLSAALAPALRPDFECARRLIGSERTYTGLGGLRDLLLDWYSPWATYRNDGYELIDAGDRVVVFVHDFGRLRGSTREVEFGGANVWTVRDGQVARIDFYSDRDEALKAVGLEE